MFIRSLLASLLAGLALLSLSCTRTVYMQEYRAVADGKYDTAFPTTETAETFEAILATVRMLNCVTHYRHVLLSEDSRLRRSELTPARIEAHAVRTDYFNDTASGTATIIHYNNGKLALLTSAHVVHFPDTLFFYHPNPDGSPSDFVRSFAVKERQRNYIPDLDGVDRLEILARDDELDVALLGQPLPSTTTGDIPVFTYPLGHSADLQWGSFVYVFGFPTGAKMMTRGLVSLPFRRTTRSFLIDAPFNHGFSGGLVVAVRDGMPNVELIGLATGSAALSEYRLVPARDRSAAEYDPHVPYEGDLFVEHQRAIRYGLTICLTVDAIRDFIDRNRTVLDEQGYRLTRFE